MRDVTKMSTLLGRNSQETEVFYEIALTILDRTLQLDFNQIKNKNIRKINNICLPYLNGQNVEVTRA